MVQGCCNFHTTRDMVFSAPLKRPCYKLQILWTYRHFNGRMWLAYDQAFCQHAAATKLVDWSSMIWSSLTFTQLALPCAQGSLVLCWISQKLQEHSCPRLSADPEKKVGVLCCLPIAILPTAAIPVPGLIALRSVFVSARNLFHERVQMPIFLSTGDLCLVFEGQASLKAEGTLCYSYICGLTDFRTLHG